MRHLSLPFSLASLAVLAALFALRPASAETCLSPFVKRLDRPEKYLYVFCVDADAKDNDFLVVIDVDRESKTCGTITHQLDLGSKGNETHHFGFTDDRTHIWGCSLLSDRLFVINVSDDPARPKLVKTLDSSGKTGLSGPHSPYALPGRMLISYLGGKGGGLPAGLAVFNNDGTFSRRSPCRRTPPTATTWPSTPPGTAWSPAASPRRTTTGSRWRRWTSSASATSWSCGTTASAGRCRP